MEWNSFVCFTVDKENGREPVKQQRKEINRTRRADGNERSSAALVAGSLQIEEGGRDEVWDHETMFSQLAKQSPCIVASG
ncbi:unnamed protein product [Porites lobata]|uniref:Uncharacterized protein n=1 Tax=Porites lobata TaxID=104759 RepID=A0ABN8QFC0_9CNID|nr:unnamed protein product [Porites lobata]